MAIRSCYSAVLSVPGHPQAFATLLPWVACLTFLPSDPRVPVVQWRIGDRTVASDCTQAFRQAQVPYDLQVRHGADDLYDLFIEYFRPEGFPGGPVRRVPTTEEGALYLPLSDWDAVAARPGGPITREDVLAHLGVPPRSLADWCHAHRLVS